MTDIGMNLSSVNYYGTSAPFIDRFKTSSWNGANWGVTLADGRTTTNVPTDKYGNPLSIPTGAQNIFTYLQIDPVAEKMTDRYVLTYDGSATFKFVGAKIISSEPGKIVIEAVSTTTSVGMVVTSMNADNPLSNIHVVREDQVALFKAGEIFNPDFIAKASQWDMLRFMDWGNTNASRDVSWATRATADNASWESSLSGGGVPLEIMVKLANTAKTDMWYNIPTKADDAYVRSALAYIRDNLDPSLKVHVEYSNEVWNWQFEATKYAQSMANKLWGKDVNGDGVINAADPKENVAGGMMQYYGYRSAQIAAIANDVFKANDSRLISVLATQTANASLSKYLEQGVAAANLGPISKLFDDYAVTTYFGGSLSVTSRDAASQAKVLEWARSGEAGMAAAFRELAVGGSLASNDSLAAVTSWYAQHAAFADANGLKLVAYEGGAHLAASSFPPADQQEVSAFFGRLMNDPRMGALYTQMVKDFADAGGASLVAFADSAVNKVGGYWGVLDNIYQQGSPRYDALLAAAKAPDVPKVSLVNAGQVLVGTAANDRLTGGAGADTLNGLAGADTMVGGLGNDIYFVDNLGDQVTEQSNGGIDEVRVSGIARYTLTANVENLTFSGSGAFAGTGNDLANVIKGGDGENLLNGGGGGDTLIGGAKNDRLNGGAGADKMYGGGGDDWYEVNDAGDTVIETLNAGYDSVTASVDYRLGDNVERLYLSGSATTGTGNALDNMITNQNASGNSTLLGLGGNDRLIGGSGVDRLYGGEGNDELRGGAGDDFLFGGSGADRLLGGLGADRFVFGEGDLSAQRTLADTIMDFSAAQGDRIDLSAIDAIAGTSNNDAFRFIGDAKFSGKAGELRARFTGGNWDVEADTNGDGIADLILVVTTTAPLKVNDFIL